MGEIACLGLCFYWREAVWGLRNILFIGYFKAEEWELGCEKVEMCHPDCQLSGLPRAFQKSDLHEWGLPSSLSAFLLEAVSYSYKYVYSRWMYLKWMPQ